HSLIELARKLITLSDRVRKGFELDDDLHAALQLAASMKPSSARERQLRYIAKSLEKTDYAAIHAALEEREKPSRETVVLHHQAEQWRDRLIAEETTVDALLEACPSLTR